VAGVAGEANGLSERRESGPRPTSLWPPGPWVGWLWRGAFISGHSANQFLRFCLVGASGVVVNYLVMLALFESARLPYVAASMAAFLVANLTNFILNKVFTFNDRRTSGRVLARQYVGFLGVSLLGLGINLAVLILLVEGAEMHPVPANLVGVLAATVSNFLGSKLYAFRR